MNSIDMPLRKISYLILATSFYMMISCQKAEDPLVDNPDDFLVFGRFYGFCMGEKCIEIYRLQDGRIYEDVKDQYVSNESFYQGDFEPLSEEKYQQVKDLWNVIPSAIYEEDQVRFGCPDCADQGGIYLEIKTGTFHAFWILDQSKSEVPNYLHELMDVVNSKVDILSNE